jgi:hypothetical protein
MGPISKKVITALKKVKHQRIIDFSEFKKAKINAQELDKSVISQKDLSKYDPLHAVYIYAQNKVSVLIDQISELPALSKLTNAYIEAEDIYMPSGPPMSPLTTSYFTCWGGFDLCVGIKKESYGTILLDVLKTLKVDPGLITLVECMQNSRMGMYVQKDSFDKYVILEELITQKQIKAIVPSGYVGEKDQIWFARILPEPFPDLNYGYSVVFTTPYILTEMAGQNHFSFANKNDWEAFFARNLKKSGKKDTLKAYESLMKYGLNRHFWNEYIFEAYVNYQTEMVLLAGFPDQPLTMPHSKENRDLF